MHPFLTVQELVLYVFRLSSRSDLLSFALVAHVWYDWAMDLIWREVDFRIFRSLAPMVHVFYELTFTVSRLIS